MHYFAKAPPDADSKERLKHIQSLGKTMYRQGEIELVEALSRVNYANAVNYFTTNDIKSMHNRKKIVFFTEKIKRYLSLIS